MIYRYKNETKLIKDLRKRKNEAFEFLRKESYDSVRVYVTANSGRIEDVEDILQESLIVLLKSINKPDLKMTSSVSHFLTVIAKNKWKNILRDKGIIVQLEECKDELSYNEFLEAHMDNVLLLNVFWQCFKKLKKDCRKILDEIMNGLSLKKIAAMLGLSYMYLKKKKGICQRNLMTIISEHPDYYKIRDEILSRKI